MKDFAQRLAVASGLAAALALLPATASAAPINVPCSSESNSNVLQNAVLEANASPGPDTIELAEGCTYTFFQAAFQGGGWFGNNALPPIASEITIEGNGATLSREESVFGDLPLLLRRRRPHAARDARLRDARAPASSRSATSR